MTTSVTTTNSVAAAAGTTASKSATLDQSAFLKLMTTQLQTQDPFNPVDNTQMIAQMAQMSSTAGIAEMNATLKSMAADIAGSRLGDASSWIGKEALLPSDKAAARADGSFAGRITLPTATAQTTLSLVDASGLTVHSEKLGPQAAGSLDFAWDGKDAGGNAIRGPLKVVVTAADAGGGAVVPGIAAWTSIAGIQSPAGGTAAKLVTPLGQFSPADALSLS